MAEKDFEGLHRLLDNVDSVAAFEDALRKNRNDLVKNLNVMSMLINRVSFEHIISEDEQGRIRKSYLNNEKEKAAGMFIDALLHSKDQTKWSVFKDALKLSEGHELFMEILCKGETNALKDHENDQAQINLQRGLLAEKWNALPVSEKLRQEEVLTTQEYEEVKATLENHGNLLASYLILTMVTRRKGFFTKLRKVLWELQLKGCVKEIDPVYYKKMVRSNASSEDYTTNDYNIDDSSSDDDDNTNADAIGFICTDLQNGYQKVNNFVMTPNITNNLDVSGMDGPIASRTRSKIKLLQQKDLDETFLKTTVLQDRQPGPPQKFRETLPARQAVIQSPRYHASHTRKNCVQGQDAATQVSRHEDEKLRKNADCQVTFDNDPQNRTAPDVPEPEFLRGKQHLVTEPTAKQQTVPSSHMDAGGKVKSDIGITARQGGYLRTVQTFPEVTPRLNAQVREICREEEMKTLRNAYSHQAHVNRDQTKSKIHKSEQIATLTESSFRKLLKPCECDKRFIFVDDLRVHQEKCPVFRKFTGQTDDGGKPCIKAGRVMQDLTVASHQVHGARIKTKSKIQSTEQIGDLTESSFRARLKQCVCGKTFITDAYLSKHQDQDCPTFAASLNRCSYRQDLKHCECGERFLSDANLMIHRQGCPESRKFTGQRFEHERSVAGGKPCTGAGRVVPALSVASNQDRADSELCGNNLQRQARGECSSQHGACGLTRLETGSSAGKRTKSPPNSEYRSLQEGTNRSVNLERPEQTHSDETERKTVLKTTQPNQTSNTDVKQTYKKFNQNVESSGGFGFQSNKTRQLNKEN